MIAIFDLLVSLPFLYLVTGVHAVLMPISWPLAILATWSGLYVSEVFQKQIS